MERNYDSAVSLLDSIIKYQSVHNLMLPWSDIIQAMKNEKVLPEGTHGFHKDAFDKLISDRYFTVTEDGFYSLSFEGLMFFGQGGYKGQQERNERAKNEYSAVVAEQRRQQTDMIRLTAIVAIGTGIAAFYYALEILKIFGAIADNSN